MKLPAIEGVLFDKDGTLFDFGATWDVWAGQMIDHFANGDADVAGALARETAYDLSTRRFLPHSVVIAGTAEDAVACFARALPGADLGALEAQLNASAAQAPLVEATPLGPLLAALMARDIRLGVMTNDTEATARTHLRTSGVEGCFDFIAGADSGWGAKPDPAPLLAFARYVRLPPARIVMVGDSTHDLEAGRGAGMRTVGVLTGPAEEADLAPLADVVLPDISGLPNWIVAQNR